MPRLQGKFPSNELFTMFHEDESPLAHWMHEYPDHSQRWHLSQRMAHWLRWMDGTNVMLANKSEAGWYYVPDRGFDIEANTT